MMTLLRLDGVRAQRASFATRAVRLSLALSVFSATAVIGSGCGGGRDADDGGDAASMLDASSPLVDGGGRDASTPTTDGAVAGAPTSTGVVEGNEQRAVVSTPVAVAPRMFVRDANNIPVANVRVSWRIAQGNGTVAESSTSTGPDGTSAVSRWTLGPTPGANRLIAEVPGLAPVLFDATGTMDMRGSLTIQSGNFQMALASTAVAAAPAVIVRDGSGAPVASRTVTFRVGSGGGTIEGSPATTGADGIARLTRWVLGPTVGQQTLVAESAGLPAVTFEATALASGAPTVRPTVVLMGRSRVWDLAFASDGTMLFTERAGRVFVLPAGSSTPRMIAAPSDVSARSQSGMLGIALDPEFAANRFVYTYLASTRPGSGRIDNRVRRWRAGADFTLTEDRDILTGITWGSDGGHSGGRIRFGPDGFLYITTGDTRSATVPQDLRELGGKVLRITRDGAPAPGNPMLGATARPEIYFVGVRNPQGIAFRPGSGDAFICEHGPNQDDEITRLVAGGNGGWNPNDGMGNYNGYSGARMSDTRIAGVVQPTHVVADSAGMSGCDFASGPRWLGWDGSLLVGMLDGTRVFQVRPNPAGTGIVGAPSNVLDTADRFRAVVRGPDGAIYVVSDSDSATIWRIAAP